MAFLREAFLGGGCLQLSRQKRSFLLVLLVLISADVAVSVTGDAPAALLPLEVSPIKDTPALYNLVLDADPEVLHVQMTYCTAGSNGPELKASAGCPWQETAPQTYSTSCGVKYQSNQGALPNLVLSEHGGTIGIAPDGNLSIIGHCHAPGVLACPLSEILATDSDYPLFGIAFPKIPGLGAFGDVLAQFKIGIWYAKQDGSPGLEDLLDYGYRSSNVLLAGGVQHSCADMPWASDRLFNHYRFGQAGGMNQFKFYMSGPTIDCKAIINDITSPLGKGIGGDLFDNNCMPKLPHVCDLIKAALNKEFGRDVASQFLDSDCQLNVDISVPGGCDLLHLVAKQYNVNLDDFFAPGKCTLLPACKMIANFGAPHEFTDRNCTVGCAVAAEALRSSFRPVLPYFNTSTCHLKPACKAANTALASLGQSVEEDFAAVFNTSTCELRPLCPIINQEMGEDFDVLFTPNCSLRGPCAIFQEAIRDTEYAPLFANPNCSLPSPCELLKDAISSIPAAPLFNGTCSLPTPCKALHVLGGPVVDTFFTSQCSLRSPCDVLREEIGNHTFEELFQPGGGCIPRTPCDIFLRIAPTNVTRFFDGTCGFLTPCAFLKVALGEERFAQFFPSGDCVIPSLCAYVRHQLPPGAAAFLDDRCDLVSGCAMLKAALTTEKYTEIFTDDQCSLPTACTLAKALVPGLAAFVQPDCTPLPPCPLVRALLLTTKVIPDDIFSPAGSCEIRLNISCPTVLQNAGPLSRLFNTTTCRLLPIFPCDKLALVPGASSVFNFTVPGCPLRSACQLARQELPPQATAFLTDNCGFEPLCPLLQSQFPAVQPYLDNVTCAPQLPSACALIQSTLGPRLAPYMDTACHIAPGCTIIKGLLGTEAYNAAFADDNCTLPTPCALFKRLYPQLTPALQPDCALKPACALARLELGDALMDAYFTPDCTLKVPGACAIARAALGPAGQAIFDDRCNLPSACAILALQPASWQVLDFNKDGSCAIKSTCALLKETLPLQAAALLGPDCSIGPVCPALRDALPEIAPFLDPSSCALELVSPCALLRAALSPAARDLLFPTGGCDLVDFCGLLKQTSAGPFLDANCGILSPCDLAFAALGKDVLTPLLDPNCNLRISCAQVLSTLGPEAGVIFDDQCSLKPACAILRSVPGIETVVDFQRDGSCGIRRLLSPCAYAQIALSEAGLGAVFANESCHLRTPCELLLGSPYGQKLTPYITPSCGLRPPCDAIKALITPAEYNAIFVNQTCGLPSECDVLRALVTPAVAEAWLQPNCTFLRPCALAFHQLGDAFGAFFTPTCQLRFNVTCDMAARALGRAGELFIDTANGCIIKSPCQVIGESPLAPYFDLTKGEFCTLKTPCELLRPSLPQSIQPFFAVDCSFIPMCDLLLQAEPGASRFLTPNCTLRSTCDLIQPLLPAYVTPLLGANCSFLPTCSDLLLLEPSLKPVLGPNCSLPSPCEILLSQLPAKAADRYFTPTCELRSLCEIVTQNTTLLRFLNQDCSLKPACEILQPIIAPVERPLDLFYDAKTCTLKPLCEDILSVPKISNFLQPNCALKSSCEIARNVPGADRFLNETCGLQSVCHVAFNGEIPGALTPFINGNCSLKTGCQILREAVNVTGLDSILDDKCQLGSLCADLQHAADLADYLGPGCQLKSPCQLLIAKGGVIGDMFDQTEQGSCSLKRPCTLFKGLVGDKLGPLMDDTCQFHLPGLDLALPGLDLTPAFTGNFNPCVMIDACEPAGNWGASIGTAINTFIPLPYGFQIKLWTLAFSLDGLLTSRTTQPVFDGYSMRDVPSFPVNFWILGDLSWDSNSALAAGAGKGGGGGGGGGKKPEPPIYLQIDAPANLSIGVTGDVHGGIFVLDKQVVQVDLNSYKTKGTMDKTILSFNAGPDGILAVVLGERAADHSEDCDLRGLFFYFKDHPTPRLNLSQFFPALGDILPRPPFDVTETISLAVNTDGSDGNLMVTGIDTKFTSSIKLWKEFHQVLGVRFRSSSEKLRRAAANCPDEGASYYTISNCDDVLEIYTHIDDFNFFDIIKVGGPTILIGVKTKSSTNVHCDDGLEEDFIIHVQCPSIFVLGMGASATINIEERDRELKYQFTVEGDFYELLDAKCTFSGEAEIGEDPHFDAPSCHISPGAIGRAIEQVAEEAWKSMEHFVKDVASSIKNEANDVAIFFDHDVKNFFENTFVNGIEDLGQTIGKVESFLANNVEAGFNTVKNGLEQGWSEAENFFDDVGHDLNPFNWRRKLLTVNADVPDLPPEFQPPTVNHPHFYCLTDACKAFQSGDSELSINDALAACTASCHRQLQGLTANYKVYQNRKDHLDSRPTVQDIQDCRADYACRKSFLPSSTATFVSDFPGYDLHGLHDLYKQKVYPHLGPVNFGRFPTPSTYKEVTTPGRAPFREGGLSIAAENASLFLHLKNVGTESSPTNEIDLDASQDKLAEAGKRFATLILNRTYPQYSCIKTKADLNNIPDKIDNDCDGLVDSRFFNRYSVKYLKSLDPRYQPDPHEDFAVRQTQWTSQTLSTPPVRRFLCPSLVAPNGSFLISLDDVNMGKRNGLLPNLGPNPLADRIAPEMQNNLRCQSQPQVWVTQSGTTAVNDAKCPEFAVTKQWNARDECGGWVDPLTLTNVFAHEGPVPTFPLAPKRQYCNLTINPAVTGWQYAAIVDPTPNDQCKFLIARAANYSDVLVSDTCKLRVTHRTFVMVDSCGRSTSYTHEIQQYDDQGPAFIDFPPDVILGWGAPYGPVVTGRPLIRDDCHDPMTLVYDDRVTVPDLSCPGDKLVERFWTATDGCGNTNTRVQRISVQVQDRIFGEASLYQIVALQDGVTVKGYNGDTTIGGQILAQGQIDVANAQIASGTCAYVPDVNTNKASIDWERLETDILDLTQQLPKDPRYAHPLDGEAAYFTFTSQSPANITITQTLTNTGVGQVLQDKATKSVALLGTNPLFNVFMLTVEQVVLSLRQGNQAVPTINIDVPPYSVALIHIGGKNLDLNQGARLATVNLLNGTSDGLLWNFYEVDGPDTGVALFTPSPGPTRVFPGTILAPNAGLGFSSEPGQIMEGQLIVSQAEVTHTNYQCGLFQGAHKCADKSLSTAQKPVLQTEVASKKVPRDELRKKYMKRKTLSLEEP